MRGYIDMGNLSSIQLDNMYIIFWSVRSSSKRGGDGVKRVDGVSLFQSAASITLFIRVHENLVQRPRNNKSIDVTV